MSGAKAAETHYSRIWAIVSILGAVVTMVVSGVNLYLTSQKHDFDGAVTIARLYYERALTLPPGQEGCRLAKLHGDAAVAMAGLDPRRVEVEATERRQSARSGLPPPREGANPGALRATALLIFDDVVERRRGCDQDAITLTGPTVEGDVAQVRRVPGAETSYDRAAPAPPPAAASAAAETYTVYIQYLRDSASGARRASDLRAAIRERGAATGFRAPGTEAVRQVPDRDQIRIYREADADRARQLQREFGLSAAQIVNLQNAFPNLPPRTMEVWLADR